MEGNNPVTMTVDDLRAELARHQITQTEFAPEIGLHQTTVSLMLGKRRLVQLTPEGEVLAKRAIETIMARREAASA